jgi:hypothetical protein
MPEDIATVAAAMTACCLTDWITPLLLLLLLQVSAAFALVLRSFGLLINSVGGETQLDLASYTFSGADILRAFLVQFLLFCNVNAALQIP